MTLGTDNQGILKKWQKNGPSMTDFRASGANGILDVKMMIKMLL